LIRNQTEGWITLIRKGNRSRTRGKGRRGSVTDQIIGPRVVHKRADEQCSARSHPYEQTSSWLDEHEQSERFGVVRSLVRELSVGEDVCIYAIAIDKPKH